MRLARRRIASVGSAAGALALAAALLVPAPGSPAGPARAESLAGRFLVATPAMDDPRFARTVIYMLKHDAGGAVGLIVNRPFEDVSIALLLSRLGVPPAGAKGSLRIHYGGPVEPGRVFVLHTPEWRGQGTQEISHGIALTTTPSVLRSAGAGHGPRRAVLVLSYSGWAPGQLERELRAGAWVSVPADAALAFDDDYETKWQRALARRGVDL